MTASSTPDLAARILAAIDETEQAAPRIHGEICGHLRIEFVSDDCDCGVPGRLLSRCAADRRTVDRHSRPGRAEACGTQDDMRVLEWCECCRALMPCPDLLDRAAAYGITAEAP